MIKAQDLRIGNILKSDTHNAIFIVNSIDLDRKYDTVSGIPLTQEILLKLGFVDNREGGYDLIDNWFSISVTGINVKTFWYETKHQDVELRWLHQLQNILYINAGQELNASKL